MSTPHTETLLMDTLPTTRGEARQMSRKEAQALGLKVYPSVARCRMAPGHGNMRVVSSNKCAHCCELEATLAQRIRATVLDRLRTEAEHKVRKELAAELTQAKRQARGIIKSAESEAQDILKAAQRDAMDKARMLEKAKATKEATKAKKAAQVPTLQAMPDRAVVADLGPSEGPPWELARDCASVVDICPWD